MELSKAKFLITKERERLSEMEEMFEKAAEIEKSFPEREKALMGIEKKIKEGEVLCAAWEGRKSAQKEALNKASKELSEKRSGVARELSEIKARVETEKHEALKEVEAEISGRQAHLLVLKRQEDELKENIRMLKDTLSNINSRMQGAINA